MNLESGVTCEPALIERVKCGERSGFDNLVGLYQQKGLCIAYSMVGNLEDAKDVLQEAFIKVYLNIKDFKEESKFSTWFYRIVVNCALDFLRKKKNKGKVFMERLTDEETEEEKEIADWHYEPAGVLLSKELAENLDRCILALPEKQKTCFILKHQNGLTTQEIAQVLKCSVSTVKVHLFRAVRTLQEKLSFYFVK